MATRCFLRSATAFRHVRVKFQYKKLTLVFVWIEHPNCLLRTNDKQTLINVYMIDIKYNSNIECRQNFNR